MFLLLLTIHRPPTHSPTSPPISLLFFFIQHKNGHIVNDSDHYICPAPWAIETETHILYCIWHFILRLHNVLTHSQAHSCFSYFVVLFSIFIIRYFGWNVVRSLNFAIEKSLQNISYCLIVHIANVVINTFEWNRIYPHCACLVWLCCLYLSARM